MKQTNGNTTLITLFYFSILAFCFLGCASSQPKVSLYTPRFTSPVQAIESANLSNISIALISPNYGDELVTQLRAQGEHQHSKLFRQSLKKDLEGLLLSKGFKIVGPFKDINEMTFPQKKQSDLILRPIMDFAFREPHQQAQEKTDWGSALLGGSSTKTVQVWEGPCTISGFIVFEVWEPLSEQKMWAKKIDLENILGDCSATGAENYQIVYSNTLGKLLEQIYEMSLLKADAYFSREEMELVKTQSTELRAKKVY